MAETVTIATAAERLGISQDTVRRRIHRGELRAQQAPTPQGFVWQVELGESGPDAPPVAPDPPPAAHEPEPPPTPAQPVEDASAGPPAEVRRLEQLVDVLQEELRRRNDELAARTREIGELHVLLQQVQRALPAAPQAAYAPPTHEDEAPGQTATHGESSPKQAPPQPPGRPWWAFWRPSTNMPLTRH
jgi:hypothetical protein